MKSSMPTVDEVKAALAALSHAQIQELAVLSGVPFMTLWNVRKGTTENPGLKTVNKFLPFVDRVADAARV